MARRPKSGVYGRSLAERIWVWRPTQRVLCLFGYHRPNRSRVRHDGREYRAPCLGCGAPMVKLAEGWKLAPPSK